MEQRLHSEEMRKLASIADSGRVPHAILLHGPSGIGKMAAAIEFVKYLNCTSRSDGHSCGHCPSCLQTAKFNNPDLHFIFPIIKRTSPPRALSSDYAEEWKEFVSRYPYMPPEKWLEFLEAGNSRPLIHVNQSEEILRLASLSSYGDGRKIFVVWQPEKMNLEAANKLLKVIEEPYSDTLFILVSNSPGEIIATIRSRLFSVEFLPVGQAEMIPLLEDRGFTVSQAAEIASMAKGNLNTLYELIDSEGERSEFAALFIDVMRSSYGRNMPRLKSLADSFAAFGREKSLRLLKYFSTMIRESFVSNLRCDALLSMTADERNFVAKFGPFINAANVEEMARQTDRAYEDISRNANQKIVWFDFMVELCRLIRTNIPKS